jgi:hypothetical protein
MSEQVETKKGPVKITQPIVDWQVKKTKGVDVSADRIEVTIPEPTKQSMNEFVDRPNVLEGLTFKIKPANEKHSLYITLTSQELDGIYYPREIFFNTKNPNHKMWMDALALTISAVFRKGSDVTFLVDEFKNVYNTEGYWGKDHITGKGRYYKSIIEEIGYIIGIYLNNIAETNRSNTEQFDLIPKIAVPEPIIETTYPENAMVCQECGEKAAVLKDNCPSCLACGYSKCG